MTTQDHSGSDQGNSEPPTGPVDDQRQLEEISEEECFTLLENQDLGRLAIVRDGRPEIFPVNSCVVRPDDHYPKSAWSQTGQRVAQLGRLRGRGHRPRDS